LGIGWVTVHPSKPEPERMIERDWGGLCERWKLHDFIKCLIFGENMIKRD